MRASSSPACDASRGMKRSLPSGVPIQVHAYICRPSGKPDTSQLRVKDGKVVEVSNGADTPVLRVDHVFQQGTEADIMERSLHMLTKACVEGVNVAVLAVGSSVSKRSSILVDPIQNECVANLIFHALIKLLEEKKTGILNNNNSNSSTLASGSKMKPSFTFEIWVSFVEFYEETMTDLLSRAADKGRNQPLVVEDNRLAGKNIKNLTHRGPITTVDEFSRLLEDGKSARRNEPGLYGHAKDFSSSVLQISLKQVFFLPDASSQELYSSFSIVESPATDRLERPGGVVRISEGPLLSRALFTFADVVECAGQRVQDDQELRENAAQSEDALSCPPYDDSHFTTMLHDVIGGNCLTFALLCITPCDFAGSKATLQLGRLISHAFNFPVVNNDMMQGLLWRHHVKAACLREQKSAITSNALSSISQNDKILVYERKIHELEGKVAQENLEKKLIREDKEKLVSLMNELKTKYNELFDNEIEVRKELLLCEQEKLALSKAFVEFEIEKNNRVKELDRDKFEMETKLIQAEQMVIEIQQDDSKKATQIQDLCAKMNEVIHEKKLLSEELAIIQKHTKQLEQDLQKEAKKNQQLSLELLVAVSQKQKSQSDLEDFEKRNRQLTKQLEEIVATSNQMKVENAELKEKQAAFESQLESMRRELVMKELQAEKAQFSSRKSQIDQETESGKLLREHEDKVNKLTSQLEAALAVAANEKKSLELQVERLSLDVNQLAKEKEDLVSAWMAKMQENEELLVAIERLIHENESEVEAYRFKLSTYTSMSNKDEAIVLKELINSYQVREKQLRNELAQFRSRNYRLGNRLRMRHARGSVTLTQLKDNQDGGQDVDPGNEKGDDEMVGFKKLQQQMAQAEGLLVLEREKYASAALVAAELENKNRSLILECQELKTKLQQSQSEGKQYVQSIQDMHETLVKQLEEVRRITLQQKDSMKQQQSVESAAKRMILASPQKAQPGTAASAVDIQALIEEKKQLEGKLAANTKQWTALVEHVERRCADLLTKNVMLKQENSDLKGNLKNVMARYQGMTNNK